MKQNQLIPIAAVLCSLLTFSNSASAQGTAFTYQGRLNSGGSPANGSYDIAFSLYAVNAGGVAIAGPVTNSAVVVTNGLFTTTVNFGSVFTGASNWLQIAVSPNGANAFSNLLPRQQLTPVPYAVYAESANATNLVGTIPAGNLSGAALLAGGNSFTGNQTIQGAVGITSNNTLQLGAGLAGQEISAGKIGYETFTSDSLDIVGAGTNVPARKIKFWAEGGAAFSGTVTANSFAGDGGGLTGLSGNQLTSIGNNNGGFGNFFLGSAGNATTSGNYNTADGYEALFSNTSGSDNTANGLDALFSNTSGSDNTAYGLAALELNTSGNYNTADGFGALQNNTGGSFNIALGYNAGASITGSSNIDIGNPGLSTDTNIIRIGSGQTATYLAGTVVVPGKISSPTWRANNVINTLGPMSSATGSFTSGGGTLVIFASGSGRSNFSGGFIGMEVHVDGKVIGSSFIISGGVTNTREAFVPSTTVVSGVAAGTHTITLVPYTDFTVTDSYDYFNVTVQEQPF
jgi:hypothetical protein